MFSENQSIRTLSSDRDLASCLTMEELGVMLMNFSAKLPGTYDHWMSVCDYVYSCPAVCTLHCCVFRLLLLTSPIGAEVTVLIMCVSVTAPVGDTRTLRPQLRYQNKVLDARIK